jgi:hypothetical protein
LAEGDRCKLGGNSAIPLGVQRGFVRNGKLRFL